MKTQEMEIKRILFIEPPGTYLKKSNGEISRKHILPPLGPAMLAAIAERNGYEVNILDIPAEGYHNEHLYNTDPWAGHKTYQYGLETSEIIRRIDGFDPQVIGISNAQAIRFEQSVTLCKIIKKHFPEIVVIVGGSNATVMYEEYINENCADLIVLGEGEEVLVHILQNLCNPKALRKIDGLACDGFLGEHFINPKKQWRSSIADLPEFAWHLLPMTRYEEIAGQQVKNAGGRYVSHNNFVAYFSSRGCPHNCTYCGIRLTWGTKFRSWKAKRIVDELQMLSEIYGTQEIHFLDSNFLASRSRAMEICQELIDRQLGIQWCVPPGFEISLLDRELMRKLRDANCYAIYLPIESGNQDQLNYLSQTYKKTKRVNLEKVKDIIREGQDLGFYMSGYFMIGFPHETRDDMIRTTDFAAGLGLDGSHFFVATPLKKTQLYDQCVKGGFLPFGWHANRMRYSIGNIGTKAFDPGFTEEMRRLGWLKVRSESPGNRHSFEDMIVESPSSVNHAIEQMKKQ